MSAARKRSPSAGVIGNLCQRKGLAMSSSVSNISFRYHPEDEQLEDYDTSASISTSNISVKSETSEEDTSGSVLGRLGIREETDKWKLFREVKGRITKSVEDKLEEIKTERLKNQKPRKCMLGQLDSSSVSDSEDPSESSQPSASDKSVKGELSKSEKIEKGQSEKLDKLRQSEKVEVKSEDKMREREESESSRSQGSTPERSTTPMPLLDDVGEDDVDVQVTRKGKGLKNMLRRKKGKTKNEKDIFEKTIAYSELCDNDSDTETIEIAQEVSEAHPEGSETTLARELDRLAHPTFFQRLQNFVIDWHIFILPLLAVTLHWLIHFPDYFMGIIVGGVSLLLLQKITACVRAILGSSEPPIKQLKDLLPLTEVPIFRRSIYDSDVAETIFQGWMNEYNREYSPESYHISLTETVYVRLEGSKLRLSSPRSKVPKRALWNEPQYKLLFNRERLFDIKNCKVELKPDGLIHRRCWSKKYPICISLSPGSKLGVRYREKAQETVDEKALWIDEEKYNFDAVSEDSDDEATPILSTVLENSSKNQESNMDKMTDILSLTSEELTFKDSVSLMSEDTEGFVKVAPAPPQDTLLYLFARTDREKELWFRRLVKAAKHTSRSVSPTKILESLSQAAVASATKKQFHLDYLNFMMNLSQRTTAQIPLLKEQNTKSHINTADLSISTDMMWINAFLGRVLYDVFQDPDKLAKIQEKIQRKLSTIKLPIFLEQLEVSQLDLGSAVPIVQSATKPTLNAGGVWVDLNLVYEGGFKMTVDTKVNLDRMKQLQAESPSSESPKSGSPAKAPTPISQFEPMRKSAVYDSDVEDSAETSSEEPESARLNETSTGTGVQHKYLRILDKVAQSKYFQQVVDYKFIKKFVSGNNLQLVVEVKGLLGTLVLNIPPPPTDRLWYGFRTNPKLWLSAEPKFGQHAVHVISRIIEKKLSLEFQRVLVLPNMDDFLVPLMTHDLPS